MTNFKLNFDNAAISKEELMALLESKGIEVKTAQPKVVDKLQYDENGLAICGYSGEHFDLSQYNEEEQLRAKKTGWSPATLARLDELNKMKSALKGTRISRPAGTIGVASKIKNLFNEIKDQLTEEHLELLTDKEFTRVNLSMSYSFLLDITGMTDEEIKASKKDAKGHSRYAKDIYEIAGKKFLMTNDLYDSRKHFEKVSKVIDDFGIKYDELN